MSLLDNAGYGLRLTAYGHCHCASSTQATSTNDARRGRALMASTGSAIGGGSSIGSVCGTGSKPQLPIPVARCHDIENRGAVIAESIRGSDVSK
jgi:hypothetical protein